MNEKMSNDLFLRGSAAGILAVVAYLLAIALSVGAALSFLLVMLFSCLGIISMFTLHRFLKTEDDGYSHKLGFTFGMLAFCVLSVFLSAQIAVQSGFEDEFITGLSGDPNQIRLVKRAVRLLDMGMDVAWDVLMGTGFLFFAASMRRHSRFGLVWAIPLALLAVALLALNIYTFPWPPADRGLFDIGPFCGLFILAVNIRILVAALQMRKAHG